MEPVTYEKKKEKKKNQIISIPFVPRTSMKCESSTHRNETRW